MAILVKESETELTAQAAATLKAYLADVPFTTLEQLSPDPSDGPDWIGKLRLPTGERLLILESRRSGQPRTARDAANQLLRWAGKYPNAVPVFAAPYISPAAAEILMRDGVGYVDLAGNCRIAFGTIYIRRADWPNKQIERRSLRSLYSPKAERILRLLLLAPKQSWKVQALAHAAGVSIGQSSNVKRLLQDREWIERVTGNGAGLSDGTGFGSGSGGGFGDGAGDGSAASSAGFVLTQPAKLLEEWARYYRFDRNAVRDFYSPQTPAQIEAELGAACKDAGTMYALTGFSAAARMAPMVRYQRATAYIAGSVDDIANRLNLKAVSSGANVSLIEPYDEGVFAGSRELDGVCIASAVQTYLDLLSFKGRGEEAAQAVLEQAVKPQW